MFFEQPLSEAFQNVDGKGIFEKGFWKGAPVGRLPPRRGGRERSEHIDESLTIHRAECDRGFACFILELLKYL
jgi:hypothetical protein